MIGKKVEIIIDDPWELSQRINYPVRGEIISLKKIESTSAIVINMASPLEDFYGEKFKIVVAYSRFEGKSIKDLINGPLIADFDGLPENIEIGNMKDIPSGKLKGIGYGQIKILKKG